ncbi:MAG: hypothetical protein LCH63_12660 [Candidatus Melainabacteria bacterium]|nr:hypothetical protein [Candidatus Melainabacteria bacterium]OPZ90664.1 MAG: hypothetical protein BWY75_00638 [bacterium ADurb.Bin425]
MTDTKLSLQHEIHFQGPQSVGDIIGQGFRIFRRNLPVIFRTLLLPTIILSLGRVAVSIGTSYIFKGKTLVPNPAWIAVEGIGIALLVAGVIILYVRQLALVRLFTGVTDDIKEAIAASKKKIWQIVALFLAWMAIMVVTLITWALIAAFLAPMLKTSGSPAILASVGLAISVIGSVLSLIFIGLAGSLAYYGLAVEDLDLGTLISKSFSFALNSLLRTIGFGFLSTLAISILAYPLNLPIFIISIIYFLAAGVASGASETTQLPVWLQVLSAIWETLSQMVLGPICHVAYGLYYLDLKMRQEGSDLLKRMKYLEQNDRREEPPLSNRALI